MGSEADLLDQLSDQSWRRWDVLGFTTRFIRLPDVRLHLVEGGSGPPLVLLHGYPQSGEIWRSVAGSLARRRTVIIPDLRGMGLSDLPPDGYQLPDLAEDVHQLVQMLGFTEVDIAGHDWGAAVGATYALRYREEVSRLVFIEGALAGAGFEQTWTFTRPNPAQTFIPLLLSGDLTGLISGREDVYLRHLWRTFTSNTERVPFESWSPYLAVMKRAGLIEASAMYYRSVYDTAPRIRDLLADGRLEIPVLSIAGASSLGVGQAPLVEAFAANIVGHVVVDNAGHFVAEEQPEKLLAELVKFLI